MRNLFVVILENIYNIRKLYYKSLKYGIKSFSIFMLVYKN